jgi:hypothetical protein
MTDPTAVLDNPPLPLFPNRAAAFRARQVHEFSFHRFFHLCGIALRGRDGVYKLRDAVKRDNVIDIDALKRVFGHARVKRGGGILNYGEAAAPFYFRQAAHAIIK